MEFIFNTETNTTKFKKKAIYLKTFLLHLSRIVITDYSTIFIPDNPGQKLTLFLAKVLTDIKSLSKSNIFLYKVYVDLLGHFNQEMAG